LIRLPTATATGTPLREKGSVTPEKRERIERAKRLFKEGMTAQEISYDIG
jgi:hypothetical protein